MSNPTDLGWEHARNAVSLLDTSAEDAQAQALVSIAFSLDRIADLLDNKFHQEGY